MTYMFRAASAAALALSLAPAPFAAATLDPIPAGVVVIDDFETGDFEINLRGDALTTTPTTAVTPGASILGGARSATLQIREGGGQVSTATFGAALGVGTEPGGVLLLSDSLNALGSLTLSYNNLGGVDLTSAGTQDGIALNFRGVDGISRVFVRVDSGSGSGTTAQFAVDFDSSLASDSLRDDQALIFAFEDYAAVDFTDVSRIVVGFDNIDTREVGGFDLGATDIALDSITTTLVPEPSTALLAAAGFGLLVTRRRAR